MDIGVCGSVADWALVFITLVYAGFTIGIFRSNRKANELTRKQLEDSKKQYEERKRLEIMPFFKITCKTIPGVACPATLIIPYKAYNRLDGDVSGFRLDIENVGLGTAKNISHFWCLEECDDIMPLDLKRESPSAIIVGEKIRVVYHIWHPILEQLKADNINSLNLIVGLTYEDLLSTKYIQKILVKFEVNAKLSETIGILIPVSYEVLKHSKLETTPEQNT